MTPHAYVIGCVALLVALAVGGMGLALVLVAILI